MTASNEYDKTLDRLVALLKRKPRTVSDIAEAMGCCKPQAYQRLRDAMTRGDQISKDESPRLPEGKRPRGPRPALYSIA